MKMTGKLHTSEEGPDHATDEKYLLCWSQEGAVDEPVTEDLYVVGGEARDGEVKDLKRIAPLWWLKLLERVARPIL